MALRREKTPWMRNNSHNGFMLQKLGEALSKMIRILFFYSCMTQSNLNYASQCSMVENVDIHDLVCLGHTSSSFPLSLNINLHVGTSVSNKYTLSMHCEHKAFLKQTFRT